MQKPFLNKEAKGFIWGAFWVLLLGAGPQNLQTNRHVSDFWKNIADPGWKEFEEAVIKGKDLYKRSTEAKTKEKRKQKLEAARDAFKEATQISPKKYSGWFMLGKVYYELERMPEAIKTFLQARRLNPKLGDRYTIAFSLGIAYSKIGQFENAIAEYERAESILSQKSVNNHDFAEQRATLNGNAAESLMALGRLDEAIQRYREALTYTPDNPLLSWGLAVAYDRDEQISRALEQAQFALANDPDMKTLTGPYVFFIPEGDVHYYFALGAWARGDMSNAEKHWKLFIQKLPSSQWVFRAQAHLYQLGLTDKSRKKGTRLAPTPKPEKGDPNDLWAKDKRDIRYTVQGYIYRIHRCYQQELKKNPASGGILQVQFVVEKNGKVRRHPRVRESTLNSREIKRCIVKVIQGITFRTPISGKPVPVSIPFKFTP